MAFADRGRGPRRRVPPAPPAAAFHEEGLGEEFEEDEEEDFNEGGSRHSSNDRDSRDSRKGAGKGEWYERARPRDGPIPPAPKFVGNIDKEPRCLKAYLGKLGTRRKLVRLQLAAEELAIRAMTSFEGGAAEEYAEDDDLERFETPDGLDLLIEELKVMFPYGERGRSSRDRGTLRVVQTWKARGSASLHQKIRDVVSQDESEGHRLA